MLRRMIVAICIDPGHALPAPPRMRRPARPGGPRRAPCRAQPGIQCSFTCRYCSTY